METKKFLIADGNSTFIAWNVQDEDKLIVTKKALETVEQVGFATMKDELPSFEMMGNELSINGTIAFASTLGETGQLLTSGVSSPISYTNLEDFTSITLPLTYTIEERTVLFEGIGFVYADAVPDKIIELLSELCSRYDKPAFGLLLYRNSILIPYVFVKATQSCVKESACGSGSVALSLLLDLKSVVQPSGGVICIRSNTDSFTITAKVVQIQ